MEANVGGSDRTARPVFGAVLGLAGLTQRYLHHRALGTYACPPI